MIEVKIETNVQEILSYFKKDFPKQLRFAQSMALYRVASDAQHELRAQLPRHFTIRTGWVARGIRIEPNSPYKIRDLSGDPRVEVGTIDDFMRLQELAGTKTPTGTARMMAVPIRAREPPTRKLTPSTWPSRMPRAFSFRQGGRTFIAQRKGKARHPLKILYVLKPQVRIPARWNKRETVEQVFRANFPERMADAWNYAIQTAK